MAHKKAGSSSKNGRDSAGKRLGVGGALVPGLLKLSWITQYVSNWAGEQGHVRNLRAAYRLGADWNLALSVNNVFDRSYETVRYFNQPGRNYLLTLRYRPAE